MPDAIAQELVAIISNPIFLSSLALAVGVYLALWLAPEPVFTKISAAATTLAILATGVFSISTIVNLAYAWTDLVADADAAESDEEIERAAERFGKRMGTVEADLLIFLASLLVGGKLPSPKGLPPAGAALVDAERSLGAASRSGGGVVIEGPWGRGRVIPPSGETSPGIRGNLALKVEPAQTPAPAQPAEVIPLPQPNPVPAVPKALAPATGPKPVIPVIPGPGLKPNPDDAKKKKPQEDACQQMLNLNPGINARWHNQRIPIGGQTTILAAAFRLDGGINPPAGQDTTQESRSWARAIGLPNDDAGHVIANRFGGRADFNAPNGNIFPQNLSFNRGTMRSYDGVVAALHRSNCDVCVHIGLIYNSPTDLRPSNALYTFLYRSAGANEFYPPVSALVPNP